MSDDYDEDFENYGSDFEVRLTMPFMHQAGALLLDQALLLPDLTRVLPHSRTMWKCIML